MQFSRRMKRVIAAGLLMLGIGMASTSVAKVTFHWASANDAQSLDPMALNATFTTGFQEAFYEQLVTYDKNLNLVPALAVKWENTAPDTWVFHLRKGVKFHNGNPFTADDVVFSWKRSQSEFSDMKSIGAMATNVEKIDDYTVKITTAKPMPILPDYWTLLFIMDKEWCQAHDATEVANPAAKGSYADLHENGTGPFRVVERKPGVKTAFKRFDDYWDKHIPTNVTDIVFHPIKNASTRVAALLSGSMDMVYPIPVQDWAKITNDPDVELLRKPEARVLAIGFDQFRDELLYANVKGKNPFKDQRVRKAFNLAINIKAINKKLFDGAGLPSGTIIANSVNGYDKELGKPYPYDPEQAKKLLAEAGYPDGFEVTLDCPNGHYLNDAKTCQAVTNMLARVGIKIDLLAQPTSKFFDKVSLQSGDKTSMYLLAVYPSSLDGERGLVLMAACRNGNAGSGQWNLGGYCNPDVDKLIKAIGGETDQAKRDAMLKKAFTIIKSDYAYMPLLQAPISWGARKGVKLDQRADNVLNVRSIIMPDKTSDGS